MVDYRIVKFCRLCRKRYTVNKGEYAKVYCKDCEPKISKEEK